MWKQKETIKANKTRLSTTPSTVIDGHWSVVLCSFLSTADKAPGPGLLHPFPNQHRSLVKGDLPIDRSPWSMDGGLVVGLVKLMGYIFVLEFYKNILHFCLLIINLLQVDVV